MTAKKLTRNDFLTTEVVDFSRFLLGKYLCSNSNGVYTAGMITETEAYAGETDKGCHAYGGKRTPRTEIMYAAGGVAYVYLCYGIHHLFNVISGPENLPHCTLIRAIKPTNGIDEMLLRRNRPKNDAKLAGGPGTLSQALGLHKTMTGADLTGNEIWIEDRGVVIDENAIRIGPRVGIDYAEEDALLPWRFLI